MNIIAFMRDFAVKDTDSPMRFSTIRQYMEILYSTQLTSFPDQQQLSNVLELYASSSATRQSFGYFVGMDHQYRLLPSLFRQRHQIVNRLADMQALILQFQTSKDVDTAITSFEESILQSRDAVTRSSLIFQTLRVLSETIAANYIYLFSNETQVAPSDQIAVKKAAVVAAKGRAIRQQGLTSPRKANEKDKPPVQLYRRPSSSKLSQLPSLAPPAASPRKGRPTGAPAIIISVTGSVTKIMSAAPPAPTLLENVSQLFPTPMVQEKLNSRLQLLRDSSPHLGHFLATEFSKFQSHLLNVRSLLADMRAAFRNEYLITNDLMASINMIVNNTVPESWRQCYQQPSSISFASWLDQLCQMNTEWDKLLQANGKPNSFFLGCFSNPAGFISALKHASLTDSSKEMVLTADITSREREMLRDSPTDGAFVHGMVLLGCTVDGPEMKTALASTRTNLPIVHLRFVEWSPAMELDDHPLEATKRRIFNCPCFLSGDSVVPILYLKFATFDGNAIVTWGLRGVKVVLL